MTRAPLFRTKVTARLNARNSTYHGHTGTVDAHDLDEARKHDRTVTLHLDDDRNTIAFTDELEVLGSPGGSCRQEKAAGQRDEA